MNPTPALASDDASRVRPCPSGSRSSGQSLVEFALVLPLLLLLCLIAIDFGRVYLGYVNLQSLARIAANYAANNPTIDWTDGSLGRVQAYERLIQDDATATNCALQPDGGGNNPPRPTYPTGTDLGDSAVVSLTCEFGLITPVIRNVFGGAGTLDVSASAVFPVKSGGVAGIGVGSGGGPQVPVASFAGSPTSGLTGLVVNFTDLTTNAPTAWTWNFGDGNGSNDQNPTHTYAAAGTYTVSLTATNADGSDTEVKAAYITVVDASVVSFTGTPTSGTAPLAVQFTDTSSGSPTAWAWTFGDGGTSTQQNPSHTYTSAGSYTVTLTVTDASGNPSLTQANYITVNAQLCVVPNVSQGSTGKVQATNQLESVSPVGFQVVQIGGNGNWKVRFQDPQGGLSVPCGSVVTIYE